LASVKAVSENCTVKQTPEIHEKKGMAGERPAPGGAGLGSSGEGVGRKSEKAGGQPAFSKKEEPVGAGLSRRRADMESAMRKDGVTSF
jgi:hypothetical protein